MQRIKKKSPLLTQEERIYELEIQKMELAAENERLHANIDYLAMMTDVEIPEEEK